MNTLYAQITRIESKRLVAQAYRGEGDGPLVFLNIRPPLSISVSPLDSLDVCKV